ncbi:MAG: hypothetical protein H0T46_15925, partial [Deltaproteobacteria bacterium]|nr:hypothetical protein [Deltaproteobacteria bacterium]
MKLALAGAFLAACSFPTPSEQLACRTNVDCESGRICTMGYCVVGVNNQLDAPNGGTDSTQGIDCTTFPARHFDACAIPQPTGDLDLSIPGVYTLDTGAGTLLAPGGGAVTVASSMNANGRVLSVSSFKLAAGTTLRAIGTTPLIVASWNTIEVAGTIDASSTGVAGGVGAGGNPAGCAARAGG